jgi:alpha/beta superfamily hydrolase
VDAIVANSVLPADRQLIEFTTSDGLHLVGELATPVDHSPTALVICAHPLPTAGGSMDSHLLRKASWRLPALTGIAVLRFNTRGTTSAIGTSEGSFDHAEGEGLDLRAAIKYATSAGLPAPWLVGWSFGTDVVLRHGNVDPVIGAFLISPPLRYSTDRDLDGWSTPGRPVIALVPGEDDYLRPAEARERFARIPQAKVIGVDGAKHLWIGEPSTYRVLDTLTQYVRPDSSPLPTEFDGPMTRWSDV